MPLPRPAPGTGKWWAVGSVGVTAMTAVAIWLGLASTVGDVTWRETGYTVVDDRTVSVSFEVTRPGAGAAICTVRAQDVSHGTVGSVEVDVPAGEPATASRTVEVRTTTRAVTGHVQTCTQP